MHCNDKRYILGTECMKAHGTMTLLYYAKKSKQYQHKNKMSIHCLSLLGNFVLIVTVGHNFVKFISQSELLDSL